MADPITPINDALSGAQPSLVEFQNPTDAPGAAPALSEVSRSILETVGEMQTSYLRETSAAENVSANRAAEATEADAPGEKMLEAAERIAAQMDAATRVQEQLTHFVMASNISSTLGRHLNLFLKGQ